MDAAWFAVFVLYVIQVLHQRPGAYGVLLAFGAPGGVVTGAAGARLTRARGTEALGAIGGGALAVVGKRAPMLAGALPMAAVTVVLAWRHRRPALA